jgi:5-methylcytosine-specific restriction endonuclease McrA
MPYKNPKDRNYRNEHELEMQKPKARELRADRQRARREMDKEGVVRKGKDIDHKKPLSKGGSNTKANLRLIAPEVNRAFSQAKGKTVKNKAPGSRKVSK